MNLWNKFVDYILGEKVIPFGEFTKQLEEKLNEYGYKRVSHIGSTDYNLFYYNSKVPADDYTFFQINIINETVGFVNSKDYNPTGCWHSFSKEYFTKQHIQALFERVEEYAKFSKQCRIQVKLDELNKDFE